MFFKKRPPERVEFSPGEIKGQETSVNRFGQMRNELNEKKEVRKGLKELAKAIEMEAQFQQISEWMNDSLELKETFLGDLERIVKLYQKTMEFSPELAGKSKAEQIMKNYFSGLLFDIEKSPSNTSTSDSEKYKREITSKTRIWIDGEINKLEKYFFEKEEEKKRKQE